MIQNEKKINEQKQTYEDTDDGIDKHIKTVITLIRHMYKKREERLCMLSRDMKDKIRFKSSFQR